MQNFLAASYYEGNVPFTKEEMELRRQIEHEMELDEIRKQIEKCREVDKNIVEEKNRIIDELMLNPDTVLCNCHTCMVKRSTPRSDKDYELIQQLTCRYACNKCKVYTNIGSTYINEIRICENVRCKFSVRKVGNSTYEIASESQVRIVKCTMCGKMVYTKKRRFGEIDDGLDVHLKKCLRKIKERKTYKEVGKNRKVIRRCLNCHQKFRQMYDIPEHECGKKIKCCNYGCPREFNLVSLMKQHVTMYCKYKDE